MLTLTLAGPSSAATPSGQWNLLVIRVDFSDATGTRFAYEEIRDEWVPTLVQYYDQISDEQLQLNVTLLQPVIRLGPRELYHRCRADVAMRDGGACKNGVAEAAGKALFLGLIDELPGQGLVPSASTAPADVFDGIMILLNAPSGWPLKACAAGPNGILETPGTGDDADKNYFCNTDADCFADDLCNGSYFGLCGSGIRSVTLGPNRCLDRAGRTDCLDPLDGRYEEIYTTEDGNGNCSSFLDTVKDPGPAVHEIGHAITWHTGNDGNHPANYNSGYELMDACYPCFTGLYTRIGPGVKGSGTTDHFPGWISDSKVVEFAPPAGGTEVISPIELDPTDPGTSMMGIKVGTSDASYYIVECRRTLDWDGLVPIPDTGAVIMQVMPGAPQEVTLIPPPGMPRDTSWKSGQVFVDLLRDLTVSVGADVGNGCTLTVNYGGASTLGTPDVGLTPWLTPPLNTWETVDIWVDSSCNGYEEVGGELRYGRDGTGDVIGNGDDACANEQNRVYARIRNYGQTNANNVLARFYVTRPLGVGIRDAAGWDPIGTADGGTFPDLVSIPPGGEAVVWVPWTPSVAAPPAAGDHFPFHSCLQVKVDVLPSERIVTNQDGIREQENIGYFEARRSLGGTAFEQIRREITLANEVDSRAARFFISPTTDLPAGWSLDIAGGAHDFWLEPGEEILVPVSVRVPDSEMVGLQETIEIEGFRIDEIRDGTGNVLHYHPHPVAGTLLTVHTVHDTQLEGFALPEPEDTCAVNNLHASGCLLPAVSGATVGMSFTSPSGARTLETVITDANGCFQHDLLTFEGGIWEVEAFWHGDMDHGSASSGRIILPASDPGDLDCDTVADGADNCATVSNFNQADSDNDSFGDACDCAPMDTDTWSAPPEVEGLVFTSRQDLQWNPLDAAAGPGVVYDLLRGSGFAVGTATTAEDCLTGIAGNVFNDPDQPDPGQLTRYVVRGRNSCATGTLGYESDLTERVSPVCP